MKKGVIITFDISTKSIQRKDIVSLHRKLYGYIDYSQNGKYKYHRQGILDKIPHLNPTRSVIITSKNHSQKIVDLLKKCTNNIFMREIILTEKDMEIIKNGKKWKYRIQL